ncbi:unnamed protein product [Aspergillus oryzae]|nr:unnamed protein product [Aspergillus oryzae]
MIRQMTKDLVLGEATLKEPLRARRKSPDSPTKTIIKQSAKGCEQALNKATIARQEVGELRAAPERMLKKKKRFTGKISIEAGASIEEAQKLIKAGFPL